MTFFFFLLVRAPYFQVVHLTFCFPQQPTAPHRPLETLPWDSGMLLVVMLLVGGDRGGAISINVFMIFIYLNIFIRGCTHKGGGHGGGGSIFLMTCKCGLMFRLKPLPES